MATLSSLKKSISEMSSEELKDRILFIRAQRRMSNRPKAKAKSKTKKKEKKLTKEDAAILLKQLTGG